MSVEEYEQEFDKLSHFATEMVATEAARTERFIQGLRSKLRGLVYAHDSKSYVAALRATVRIDADAHERDKYHMFLLVGTFVWRKRR